MADDDLTIATITIIKTLTDDDVLVSCDASSPDGQDMALIDVLGMLRLAEDTFIRRAMGEDR